MMPRGRNAISMIEVPHTPTGVEMLGEFRRKQLHNIAVAWAVPAGSLVAMFLFAAFQWIFPIIGAGLICGISGALAPGLTVVFLLRRRVARQVAGKLPQLAAARLLSKGREGDGPGQR